eukprot:6073983-Pleurochrysis_carterae.AAC.1
MTRFISSVSEGGGGGTRPASKGGGGGTRSGSGNPEGRTAVVCCNGGPEVPVPVPSAEDVTVVLAMAPSENATALSPAVTAAVAGRAAMVAELASLMQTLALG